MDRNRVLNMLVAKGKSRPSTLFEAAFFDLRKKAKDLKQQWSEEARVNLGKRLAADLQGKGLKVVSLDVKLGRYKGSSFITSSKLSVQAKEPFKGEEDERLKQLVSYLKTTYSPKWKLKSVSGDGIANLNIR